MRPRWVVPMLGLVGVFLVLVPPPAASGRAEDSAPPTVTAPPAEASIRAMVANVGNVSPHCAEQAFSLCLLPVEERVAAGLAAADPDVVALIEVLPPDLCDGLTPQNPFNSCALEQDPPQVMRLLAHDDYDVVCADRYAWDCLAVRASAGSIAACPGGYCGPVVPAFPVADGCDDGFQTFVAEVEVQGHRLAVGVGHPDSMDVDCRAQALRDLFAAAPTDREMLVLGDLNLDPYRERDASVDVWDQHVGESAPFGLRSGTAEHDPPYFTLFPFESAQIDPSGSLPINVDVGDLAGARTIDHVVATDGVQGGCVTLGEAPGSGRLEGQEGGLDHRALLCDLHLVAGTDLAPDPRAVSVDGPSPAGSEAAPGRPGGTAPLPVTGGALPQVGVALLAGLALLRGARHR